MDTSAVDLLAVGCGPFNLGLMALASTVDELSTRALDAADAFDWHPGLMFDDAMLQVPFLADLVSLVEPTHPLSFLAYIADVDRMYPFYIRERFHMTREEYRDYLQWAIRRLGNIEFGRRVEIVHWSEEHQCYQVEVSHPSGTHVVLARNLVVGIGTQPSTLQALRGLDDRYWLHSGDYLERIDDIERARRVTVVGSGQSGAEVVLDLLRRRSGQKSGLSWLTRTESFAPLDYTKLVLEMTTPQYVQYFHGLPQPTRDTLVGNQWRHYKGISTDTLEEIHDLLYRRAVRFGNPGVELRFGVEVNHGRPGPSGLTLDCRHRETTATFQHATDLVVSATGYRHRKPSFLEPLLPDLEVDDQGRLVLDINHAAKSSPRVRGDIFVVNADLHSHGVAAPDLGICAYRNARILNTVAGRTVYRLPKRTAFTQFGTKAAEADR